MQGRIKTYSVKGISKISQSPFQSIQTRKLPIRDNTNANITKKNNLFFNLKAFPIKGKDLTKELTDLEIRQVAKLLVKATQKFTGSIDDWQFTNEDCMLDLILRCLMRLRNRVGISHIDVVKLGENEIVITLKTYIDNRDTVHSICLKPILKLKNKNKPLFDILISFIKNLPFDSIFDAKEYPIDWILTTMLEDLEQAKKQSKKAYREHLNGSIRFLLKNETVYKNNNSDDWENKLSTYKPQKQIYKDIKELLLKSYTIDFNAPFKISLLDEDECGISAYQTFLITDEEESDFTHNYIQILNDYSNDYDMVSVYSNCIVSDNFIDDLDVNINQSLKEVEDFILDFNNLLKNI